jgi:molybdopterin-guanine dinucleotide biosynthesis protein MobB
MPPCIVGFYGGSDTGKTSILTRLIERLKREGYTVAAVKQTNKPISIDTGYKDTWRMAEAGADVVVFKSSIETDIIIKKRMNTNDILKQISSLGLFDCLLVEGASDPEIPKIRMDNSRKRANTLKDYRGDFNELYDYIKGIIDENKKIKHQVSLFVNGKNIPLSEFPSLIITNILLGVGASLKGIESINNMHVFLHLPQGDNTKENKVR